jgi:hypothetical protein
VIDPRRNGDRPAAAGGSLGTTNSRTDDAEDSASHGFDFRQFGHFLIHHGDTEGTEKTNREVVE